MQRIIAIDVQKLYKDVQTEKFNLTKREPV